MSMADLSSSADIAAQRRNLFRHRLQRKARQAYLWSRRQFASGIVFLASVLYLMARHIWPDLPEQSWMGILFLLSLIVINLALVMSPRLEAEVKNAQRVD